MSDQIEIALQIPCLECGSMPVVGHEWNDYLRCPNDAACSQSLFEKHFSVWPSLMTKAEMRKAWKEREE